MYYVCTILVYLQPLIPSNTHERTGIHTTKNIGRYQDLATGHVIKKVQFHKQTEIMDVKNIYI